MNSLIAVLVSFVVCIMYNLSIFQLAGQEVNGVTSMTAEELYRTFKIFKEKSHDDAPKLVSEAIDQHDFNRDSIKVYGWCLKAPSMHFFISLLQWLSIGTGYGDMEQNIFQLNPGLKSTLTLLECYEPGKVQFQHLKREKFSCENVKLHNEELLTTTPISEKYNVITLFHVHYYWRSVDERRAIFQKLFESLDDNGIIVIITLDKVIAKDNVNAIRGFLLYFI